MKSRRAPLAHAAFVLLLVLSLIVALAPAGDAQNASPDSSIISRGSQVRGGPSPDLVILFAGEVMGWTEPCG